MARRLATTLSLAARWPQLRRWPRLGHRPRLRLNQRIGGLVAGIVLLAVAVMAVTAAWAVGINHERTVGRHMLNLARMVADLPEVRAGFAAPYPPAVIQPLSERLRKRLGVDLIVIINMASVRYSHYDPQYVLTRYTAGDEARALRGESYVTRCECVGIQSVRGLAPIYGDDGRQVGVAVVGTFVDNLAEGFRQVRLAIYAALALALLLGGAGAWWLARGIKRATFGLEPAEIGALLQQREAVLHSIHEGLIAVDPSGRITLVNEAARRLLGLSDEALGRPVEDVVPNSRLHVVLRTRQPEFNQEQAFGASILLANRLPVFAQGQLVGAIATFRDRTEVSRLAEELTGVRRFVEALRAQSHEFMNRLQAISGLIQLRQYRRAVDYIASTTRARQGALTLLTRQVRDPAVAGLLLGKMSEARERGVALAIDPATSLAELPAHFDHHAAVMVIGNLIENAIESFAGQERADARIDVRIEQIVDALRIAVQDNGPGVPAALGQAIFARGVSSKGEGRGLGLALVAEQVRVAGGTIRLVTEPGGGARFEVLVPLYTSGAQVAL